MPEHDIGGGKERKPTYEELGQEVTKLRHLLNQVNENTDDTIWMESGVSAAGHPFVHLHWGQQACQLDIEDAKQHGLNIIECAHAAQYDAIFVQGLQGTGMPYEDAVRALGLLRQQRDGASAKASMRR